jgi:transposase
MAGKRPRTEHTEEWQEILPLCVWPEQIEYERIRHPVLFGDPVPEHAEETGVSERTLRRRIESFEKDGIEGLLSAEKARRRRLSSNVRRLIVDLKAEYPPFNLNEIANIVRACFGAKPDVRSVKRVLDEEALPLKLERNYPRYHEMEAASPGEGRAEVVELRVDGKELRWGKETDALCLQSPPRVLDFRRAPPGYAGRAPASRGQGLCHNDPGELFQGCSRQLRDAPPGRESGSALSPPFGASP